MDTGWCGEHDGARSLMLAQQRQCFIPLLLNVITGNYFRELGTAGFCQPQCSFPAICQFATTILPSDRKLQKESVGGLDYGPAV